jgi:hypothetical protein
VIVIGTQRVRGVQTEGVRVEEGITELYCCFCGELVKPGEIDPCQLELIARAGRASADRYSQQFWCHASCASAALREAVVTEADFYAELGLAGAAGDD